MNAQNVTGRMLQSLSADKNALIDDYLLAFGVTKIGDYKQMPPVFKSVYEPEWEAFNRSFNMTLHNATKARTHLYHILEFVRYMQSAALNPFAKSLRHPREAKMSSSARFKPVAVYEKLIESGLKEISNEIDELMRKNQLNVQLKIQKSKSEILYREGQYSLVVAHVLVPSRKGANIDEVLSRLQGTLYGGSSVPVQLRERKQVLPPESRAKPKVLNDKAELLLKGSQYFDWYPIRRTKSLNASLVRARDGKLVFKVLVYLELDVNLGSSTKNTLFKLWKNISKT
jgi:hypothetical protein